MAKTQQFTPRFRISVEINNAYNPESFMEIAVSDDQQLALDILQALENAKQPVKLPQVQVIGEVHDEDDD